MAMTRILKLALMLAIGAAAPAMAQTWRPSTASTPDTSADTPPDMPYDAPSGAQARPAWSNGGGAHEAVASWLARNVPASRGREVFVSGDEAFWFEHQDRDARRPMHVVATIHTETFEGAESEFRSSYQVTDFDCERQTQHHVYLRRYRGLNLSGDVREEHEILNLASFVGPTNPDYAHLRTVCLPVYDEIRKRTYSVTVPGR
jgi:hypothetical protein